MHTAGLTAGHCWILGGGGRGLWLVGDWKVCQAQYIIFMRVASGHMFCVESIFIVYKCTPLCIMLVYLLSTMHNGMKHGLVCVEREGFGGGGEV